MMPVEQGWGKEQVLHRQCGIPCYGIGLFLGKKIMEKKNLFKFINTLFSIRVWLHFFCTL